MFDIHLCLTVTSKLLGDKPALTHHALNALRALQSVVPSDVARVAWTATLYTSALADVGALHSDVQASANRTLTALTLAYGDGHALVRSFRVKFAKYGLAGG